MLLQKGGRSRFSSPFRTDETHDPILDRHGATVQDQQTPLVQQHPQTGSENKKP